MLHCSVIMHCKMTMHCSVMRCKKAVQCSTVHSPPLGLTNGSCSTVSGTPIPPQNICPQSMWGDRGEKTLNNVKVWDGQEMQPVLVCISHEHAHSIPKTFVLVMACMTMSCRVAGVLSLSETTIYSRAGVFVILSPQKRSIFMIVWKSAVCGCNYCWCFLRLIIHWSILDSVRCLLAFIESSYKA